MTTAALTITEGYKGNVFLQDEEGDYHVICGYNNGEFISLNPDAYASLTHSLNKLPSIASPFVEVGRTFKDKESARRYVLALCALESLERIRKTGCSEEHSKNRKPHVDEAAEKIISGIISNGFYDILLTNPKIRENSIIEKLGLERFRSRLESLVAV